MTIPSERYRALLQGKELIESLCRLRVFQSTFVSRRTGCYGTILLSGNFRRWQMRVQICWTKNLFQLDSPQKHKVLPKENSR